MKRLTTFCAAVMMAAMSFAAVEYVLPTGAVTNDYGWMSKVDMYNDFMAACIAGYPEGVPTYDQFMAMDNKYSGEGIGKYLLNTAGAYEDATGKWDWLKNYLIATVDDYLTQDGHLNASALGTAAFNSAHWRYESGAFFFAGQMTGWPYTADFANAGTYDVFKTAWKHGFDNPTEVAEGVTWTLNAPYLEGESFRGWFDNEAGSGTPIKEITSATTGKLYAKFGEYIPSIKEVRTMEAGTETKTHGVVTYVGGKNVYIADGGVGILVYLTANYNTLDGWKDLKVADDITISGKYTVYMTFPEMTNNTLISAAAGTPATVTTTTLATIVADPQALYGTPVLVEGVKISKYDSYGNVYVTDGTNELEGYYMTPDQTALPVGTKVNIKAVVANYNENVQFVGNTEDVVAASAAGKDTYAYPVRDAEGDFEGYTLTNEWIYANTYDNYSDNAPGNVDQVRGMVAKDGKMYFINNKGGGVSVKGVGSLTVVDGATGEMLDPIAIQDNHLFEAANDEGEYSMCATLSFNDIKLDNAGHAIIGGCVSGGNRVQIYVVDLATGAATELINERLYDSEDTVINKINYRFDAYGVYGDVTKDATVMACNSNGMNAFRWHIKGGVAGKAELVELTPGDGVKSFIVENGAWNYSPNSTAPQIFPLEGDMFYVDYHGTLPMLFDAGTESYAHPGAYEASLLDDFANVPTGVYVGNAEGDTCRMNQGHNGLAEFQIGDEYFLVMAATNTEGTPSSAYALFKYKDAAKSFAEMEPMWYFPANGMGKATAGARSAVPYVEVNGKVAKIYLYTLNNGYAAYTFTGKEGTGDGLENIIEQSFEKAQKVLENGVIYIYRDGVRYNVMGAQVK
ncbi:MAG: hypothetical protein IJ776_08575 [Paludibacteraceae bacterium]|nr:hypothetical protein [Paludibacteraceae bacterium]